MMRENMHTSFLLKEMRHGWQHGLLFILCVALSLTTLTALNGFHGGVNRTLFRDARELHGGDILVHSHYPISKPLMNMVESLQQQKKLDISRVHLFYTVARNPAETLNLFVNIKAVDNSYPLYGSVELASGKRFSDSLLPGTVVVAEDVLVRLDLAVGDTLNVGERTLRIVDTIQHESDTPVNLLRFGPRVYVHDDDLVSLALVGRGSRVAYELLLKVHEGENGDKLVELLKSKATVGQERINTYRDAESGFKRFFENLLFFLSLIAIFTLLLAGVGMQSCIKALIGQKEKTIAIIKTMGATSRFVYNHYLLLVLMFGAIGAIIGVGFGAVLTQYLPHLFAGLLPIQDAISLSAMDLGEGLVLGCVVVVIFTFLPLYQLRAIKPVAILRQDSQKMAGIKLHVGVVLCGIFLLTLLVIKQLEDVKIGLIFMGVLLGLILLITVFSVVVLGLIQMINPRRLGVRQAMRSMTRKGNATGSIIVTIASALSLLFTIFLVEYNLHRTFIDSYPDDAPNLFFIDIQSNQIEGFSEFFQGEVELHPIIRARLTAISGKTIKREDELRKKRDNFAREFNLTYRKHLLKDERLVEGDRLFTQRGGDVLEVSVLDAVQEMGDLNLGDVIQFNIQGVEVSAQVSSIRSRTKSRLSPFFYFVFSGDYLKKAPQTFFGAVKAEQGKVAFLKKRIVEKYPNISFIDVAETARSVEVLMKKLTTIINFFALFSLLAGGLILISSILATRIDRVKESVYYRILGGKTRFVLQLFFYENMILGCLSGVLALGVAQGCSWAICTYMLDIDFSPNLQASFLLIIVTVVTIVATGLLSSVTILQKKPAIYLREHANG